LPAIEAMLTMRPYLAFTMCGATARPAQELAGEIDAQHALPFVERVFDGRRVEAGDAGVVHCAVKE